MALYTRQKRMVRHTKDASQPCDLVTVDRPRNMKMIASQQVPVMLASLEFHFDQKNTRSELGKNA